MTQLGLLPLPLAPALHVHSNPKSQDLTSKTLLSLGRDILTGVSGVMPTSVWVLGDPTCLWVIAGGGDYGDGWGFCWGGAYWKVGLERMLHL